MKRTHSYREMESNARLNTRASLRQVNPVRTAVAQMKQRVLGEYAGSARELAHMLRLALNEAEALAWQTEFPHLFFPALAVEKAQSAVQWHERQRGLLRHGQERSFAE